MSNLTQTYSSDKIQVSWRVSCEPNHPKRELSAYWVECLYYKGITTYVKILPTLKYFRSTQLSR